MKLVVGAVLAYAAFAFVAATRVSTAQTSVWQTEAQLPYTPAFHQAFAGGDTLTVIGGDIGSGPVPDSFQSTIRRDGSIEQWVSANPLPGPVADASLAVGPAQVFLVGGTNGRITLRSVMRSQIRADGTLGPWVMLPELLPEPRRGVRAFVQGGRLVVMGGRDEAGEAGIERLVDFHGSHRHRRRMAKRTIAPAANRRSSARPDRRLDLHDWWRGGLVQVVHLRRLAGFSAGWRGLSGAAFPAAWSASVAVGNRIHVFGGSSSSGIIDTWASAARQANGTMSAWQVDGLIPQRLVGAVAVAKDGRVFLTGGFNGVRFQSTVYRWDTADAVQAPVQTVTLSRPIGIVPRAPAADLPIIPAVGSVAIVSLMTAVVLLIRERFQSPS